MLSAQVFTPPCTFFILCYVTSTLEGTHAFINRSCDTLIAHIELIILSTVTRFTPMRGELFMNNYSNYTDPPHFSSMGYFV